MPKYFIKILCILSPIFWFMLLFSISLAMFHWRIANEPGATETPQLKTATIICLVLGLFGTLVINYLFIKKKEKGLKTIWIANLIATIVYLPVLFLSFLMMA